MTRLAVEPELLENLVARMAAFERQVDALHDEVDARVRQVHTHWAGAAATEQDQVQRRWSAGVAEMRDALQQLRAMAATAHANYTSAARANVSMWAGSSPTRPRP